jgi:hypothetical protein
LTSTAELVEMVEINPSFCNFTNHSKSQISFHQDRNTLLFLFSGNCSGQKGKDFPLLKTLETNRDRNKYLAYDLQLNPKRDLVGQGFSLAISRPEGLPYRL